MAACRLEAAHVRRASCATRTGPSRRWPSGASRDSFRGSEQGGAGCLERPRVCGFEFARAFPHAFFNPVLQP